MTSSTPILDSYPMHKAMIIALRDNAKHHELNKHIFWLAIELLIDVIGDDDLYFELQEMYEKT